MEEHTRMQLADGEDWLGESLPFFPNRLIELTRRSFYEVPSVVERTVYVSTRYMAAILTSEVSSQSMYILYVLYPSTL